MNASPSQNSPERGLLRLFVSGDSPNSRLARKNLDTLLAELETSAPQLQVVDVSEDYSAAQAERVLVTPTLIISIAGHKMRIMGTLQDTSLVRQALGMSDRD